MSFPWPFSYIPWPINILAIWAGYSLLLITVYCALIHFLRIWRDYPEEEDYLDEKWKQK